MAPSATQRGFTLLELIAAVAVLAILLGMGVPTFADVIRNNQISTASSDLVSSLALARSEAMKRGVRVSICAAATQDTCATGEAARNWSTGWIVFEDDFGGAGVIESGDVPLQNWGAAPAGVNITAPTGASTITFTRRARAEFAAELKVAKKGCSRNQRRAISVGVSGRVSLKREDCTSS